MENKTVGLYESELHGIVFSAYDDVWVSLNSGEMFSLDDVPDVKRSPDDWAVMVIPFFDTDTMTNSIDFFESAYGDILLVTKDLDGEPCVVILQSDIKKNQGEIIYSNLGVKPLDKVTLFQENYSDR